jgi:hypothetical protein
MSAEMMHKRCRMRATTMNHGTGLMKNRVSNGRLKKPDGISWDTFWRYWMTNPAIKEALLKEANGR